MNKKINNAYYQFANPFHEGFASVKKSDNERTYLDTLGNEVPYIFEDEFSFREGILSYIVYHGKNLVIDISNGKTYFNLSDGYQVDKIFCKDFIRWRYNIGGENARVNMETGEILNPGIDYDGYMTGDKKVFFYPDKK
jgi:hypothetical protein